MSGRADIRGLISRENTAAGNQKSIEPVLHRAPLVVPVAGGPIENGGVLCLDGVIIGLGPTEELQAGAARVLDHEECVITPALVNAHAHLELSYLAGLGQSAARTPFRDMPSWIAALLETRQRAAAAGGIQIREAAHTALAGLRRAGTALVADTGNQQEAVISTGENGIEVCFLRELLGFSPAGIAEAHKLLDNAEPASIFSAHAPYSTAAELINAVKRRGAALGHPFSVHVAESAEEIEFLRHGGGPFRTFLERRGAWDGSFSPPASGAIEYLDRLKALDSRTICVHCVHISETETALLAARQAKVCLCPGSNRTLRVGKPPVAGMLAAGLLPAIGTDSLASNPRLDIWHEMRLLREDHPGIRPDKVFAMATIGGAAALGAGHRLGSLAPGKSARMLAVRADTFSPKEIFDYLTTRNQPAQVKWLNFQARPTHP